MKSLKKKVLVSAVLAAAAGSAHAVYVNQNGQGQALIYPYYTVQGGHNTYVSVVNTTSAVKVVKVRFREGKASAEVLDFNLYLSPNDVWTGAVVPSPDSQASDHHDRYVLHQPAAPRCRGWGPRDRLPELSVFGVER